MATDITRELDEITGAEGAELDLDDPRFFINRELSWLQFNRRVLELAVDESIPLLERLKFLCISSTNLDEFFEVRVSRLKEQVRAETYRTGPDAMTPAEQIAAISDFAHDFVDEQYRILNDVLIPELDDAGIRFVKRDEWTEEQAAWVERYFHEQVLPVLSPLGIDPSHPFPRVLNKSLNFIVSLRGRDAFGRHASVAVVQAPRSLPRLIQLPEELAGKCDFVFLSSVIHAHVEDLFPGLKVKGCFQFRVTRNSDLFVDEEEMEDLRIALQDELFTRNYGRGVRLEVADNCSEDMASFLLDQVDLAEQDLYQVNGPVNLNRLLMIPAAVERPDLKFQAFVPDMPAAFGRHADVFEAIRDEGPLLLHHPYQSFTPVMDFIRQAATDPNVLAIKMTLYRTDADSALTTALVDAARAGKEVTVVVELRARFDEARNIQIANRLQDAGAHVVYGVVGYKTHAKMAMVVRREDGHIRRYVHVGTGNYHPRTTRLYTDFGMMTADESICSDIHKMFMQLTGLGKAFELERVMQSPFELHEKLLRLIESEQNNAERGLEGRIIAKLNALTEPEVIKALYRASQAGVEIDLIVRGICCLRAGVPGVSENIRVRSIVGRFLEHARAYYFYNDGKPKYFLASADWMNRNLFRRVEQASPVDKKALQRRIQHEAFDLALADNMHAWVLQPDGTYVRRSPDEGEERINLHLALLRDYTGITE